MKRGSRLATRTPLERRTPIQAKRWGIKYRRPRRLDRDDREKLVNDFDGTGPRVETVDGHDQARLDWCATQVCLIAELYPRETRRCQGQTVPCHEGERKPGMALKSSDKAAIPMCWGHHNEWTDHVGFFKEWTKEVRRAFGDEQGAAAQARYLSHGGRRAA